MIDETNPLSLDLGAQDPVAQDPKPQPAQPAPAMQQPVQPQQDPARREQDLLARFGMALQSDPNLAAEARAYGMSFGTSVEWTVGNIKAAREMMKRREMEDLVRTGRLTAGAEAVLQNEWDANVAFDQIQNLGTLDRMVGAFESGLLQSRIGLLQDNLANDIPLTQEELRSLEEWKKQLERLPQMEDVTLTGFVSGFLRAGGQQVGLLPESVKTAIATGTGGAISGSTVPGFGTATGWAAGFGFGLAGGQMNGIRRAETGSAYAEYRAMGYTHEAAAAAAKKVGWINMGIEAVGTAVQFGRPLLAPLKKRVMGEVADMLAKPTLTKAVGKAVVDTGLGIVSQGAEEATQELSLLLGQTWARDASIRQGADPSTLQPTAFEDGTASKRILDAAVQGAIASVIPSALGSGYRLHWDVKRAKAAANQKDFVGSISANASQQDLLKRAPDLLTKALAATMRGTSAETMYFDSRLLLQAVEKLDQQQNEKTAVDGTPRMSAADQLERAFPGLLERARAAVGDVTIPTAEWVKLSGTDLGNELMQYATLDPDTPSPHEAGIAKGQAGSEALKQRSDQLLKQAEKMASEDETLAEDVAKAKRDVTKQLVEAGAYSARESKLFAELLVAHATVYGKKLGLTPTQFFEQYPLPKTVVAPDSPAQAAAGEMEARASESVREGELFGVHWTNAEPFDAFDPAKIGSAQRNEGQVPGFWFTGERTEKSPFGSRAVESGIRLTNPKVYERAEDFLEATTYSNVSGAQLRQQLESEGYDGIVIRPAEEWAGSQEWETTNIVAFRPEQVRMLGGDKLQTADAGVFDAANPPAPLNSAARGPVVMAVMTYDGKVYYDRNATMHGELADKFPEIADSIIDGGFIRDGKYVMGMSDGGYSVFEGDEDMVARARMFTEQVNSRGGELRSQDAMQKPASPIPMSALNVLHSDSKSLARPEGKKKKTKAIVAAEIKQVAVAHWGVEVNSKMLEEAHDEAVALQKQIDEARAADAGADVAALEKRIDDLMQIEREITVNLIDEAIAALRASNRNAADWYTTAIEAALAAAAVIHPELADDAVARQIPAFANEPNPSQAARFVLRSALAITSQNNTVADNTKYAEQVYANFVATGLFNAGEYGGKKGGINGNLLLFNELLPLLGTLEKLEGFARSEYTVRALEAAASKVLGREVTIEGRKDDFVNGSAVFGPKIGQGFLQNLLGNFNPVTIDLWMRRTWGRLTGDVVGEGVTGKAGTKRLANFIAGMRAAGKKLPPALSRLKVYESVSKAGAVSRSMSEEVESRVEEEESLRLAAAQASRDALKEWDQLYKLMRLPITPAMRAEAPLSQVMKMSDEQRTALFDSLVARLRRTQKELDRAFDALSKKSLAALDAEWSVLDSAAKKQVGTRRDLWMSKQYEAAGRTTTFERSDQLPEFNNEGTDSVISELTPLWAKAAKTIKANLEPIDIPSPADRRVISRVVNKVRKGLAEQGIVVTNADVQAILWYPEKDLWSKLQNDKDNDLNKSYDDEFLRIAAERGLEADAQAAVDAVRARRAGGQQVSGAVGVDGADGRSADQVVRGSAGQAVLGDESASGQAPGQVGGELRSRDSTPRPLFSALERAIASTPPGAMSARQWSAQLDRLVRTGAVKEQERFWSGIDEWLNLSTDAPGFVEFDDDGNQVRKLSRAQYLERLRTDPELESRVEPEPDSGTRQISRGDVVEFLRANRVEVMSGEESQQAPDRGDSMWVVSTLDDGAIGDFSTYEEAEQRAEEWKQGWVDGVLDTGIEVHTTFDSTLIPEAIRGLAREGEDVAVSVQILDAQPQARKLASQAPHRDDLRADGVNQHDDHYFLFRDEEAAANFRTALMEDKEVQRKLKLQAAEEVAISDPSEERESPSETSSFAEYSAGANLPSGVRGQTDYRNVGIVLGGSMLLFEAPWTHFFKEAEGGVDLNRNRLAHYRASTRKVDGKEVMFVEEVQTDWGQQGRDRGFYPRNADSVSIRKAESERRDRHQRVLAEMEAIRQKAKDKGVPEWARAFMSDADERQDWSSVGMAAEADRLRYMAAQEAQLRASPEAEPNEGPFVTKTDDWATLALKHIVMDAAKRGQRKIVFVNGEQAAAMFSLSSVFNRVSWQDGDNLGIYKQITFHRDSLGTGVRITVTKDGTVISANSEQVIGEKLSAVAGAEIADKILSQWDTPRADNPRIFSGEMAIDATLGGEGMHTFYGNQDGLQSTPAGTLQANKNGEPMPAILPKVLRELAAKIGAKVVEGVQVDDLYGQNIALELTDETMRVLSEEGMPLFARGQNRRTLGSFSPSANRITLYQGYNRGTWLHEWGHYWLESTSAIVAGGNAPAELVADLGSLLDWFGIQPTATQSRLEVWAGMDLEARRKYHEKFAYHFEIYLAKGEAPSPELEGTFARIGAWIRDVYRSLQEMVRRLGDLYREEFGEDLGLLSPEAQRVMDRIFAVDEDIERAAVERELRPMFQTRDEALAGGMSEAAWDEYQADMFLAKERAKDELIAAADDRARSTMNRARRESLDMKAEEKEAREEMQPQVEAEVQNERVVRARRWLRKGEVVNADGSVTKMPTAQKLHRDAVKKLMGIGTDKPKVSDEQFGKLRGMLADDGVDPNEVAPMLRYDTGEQLVRDLIDQPTEQEMVGVRVDARMRREYPEFYDADARRNRIERAIANDLRMGTLANELLHLQRAILTSPAVGALAGPAKASFDEANRLEVEQKSLREQASELDLLAAAGILTDATALRAQANKLTDRINRLRRGSGGEQTRRTILSVVRNAAAANLRSRQIRDISPRALNAAAARMGRETMQALKDGNFVAAIDAKRRQLVLTEMARQAVDVADEVSSILRMARSFAKPDERLAKTHTMPLIYVGRVVLSAYGLRDPERDVPTGRDPMMPTRIDEAIASVREMNEALANELSRDVVAPMVAGATGDYRDLTLEQFRVLRDNLEMLWYRSREERFTLVEGQKQSLDETVELLLAAPGAVAPDRPAVGVQSGGTTWDELVHDLLAGKAARKRVEHWCVQMDGGTPGWWHRAVFQRLANAETLAEQYERQWVTRAAGILQRLVPMMQHEPITWEIEDGRTYTFGARGSVVGRTRNGPATAELFMAIMHAQGNLSNKEKLLLDPKRGWGSQDIDPMTGERSLNSAAWDTFFAEQVRAGVITKELLDAAQEIGDLHEEMKPFLQQAHIEAFGFPFGTVEAMPFDVVFPDGTKASYRGWYLPAKADRLMVQDADLQAEDALVEARTSLAQTPRDMTKARDPNTFRSLSLQLSLLPGHIRESARFAAMGPAIVDVMKLLNKRQLKARLDAINPRLRANMLQPWVKNAALLTTTLRDESDTPLQNKFMRRLDRAFTYLTMFGNVVNAVQNPAQLVPGWTVLVANHGANKATAAMMSAAAGYGRNPKRMAQVIRSMSDFMDGRGNEDVRQANKRIQKMMRDDVGKMGKAADMRADYEQYLLDSTYVLQSMTQHIGDQITWKAAYSLEVQQHDEPAVAERRAVAYADSVVRRTQGSLRATDKSASEVTTGWKAFLNKFSGYFVQMANLSSSMIGAVRQQAGTRNRRLKYLGLYLGLWGIPFALSALIAKAGMGSLTDDDDRDGEWWDDLAWDILVESQVRPLFPLFGSTGRAAEMIVNIVDNDQGTMARMPSPAPFAALERAAKGVARALDGKPATTMDGGDIATLMTLLGLPVPLPKQAGYLIDAASGAVEPTVRGAITGRAAKDEKR